MTPTADDLAEIADLPVAEVLEVIELRGIVPPGWASDESRAWDVSASVASVRETMPGLSLVFGGSRARNGFVASTEWDTTAVDQHHAFTVTLTRNGVTREGMVDMRADESDPRYSAEGALDLLSARWHEPATTADLCAVLSIDWRRAEMLAREVVRTLREYGHRGGDVRVVWRVVEVEPLGEHDLISPTLRALDRAEAWSGHVEHEGRRVPWHLWGDGVSGTGIVSDGGRCLPPARELVAMGLRLGRVTDDAVTLVCPR